MTVNFAYEANLAKQLLEELESKSSTWSASGAEFSAWKNKVLALIRRVYGAGSQEEKDFNDCVFYRQYPVVYGGQKQNFMEIIPKAAGFLEARIQDLEIRDCSISQPACPKALIAHGGETQALNKVSEFLRALGIEPLVVEKAPSEGRSIDENVDWCLDQADCAIILATQGDIDVKTKAFIPRGNILIEVGRCQERFPDKTVYLLEKGTTFPTNISEKVWQLFTQDNMERAFVKIARELVAFGLLKAVKGESPSSKR